MDRSVLKNFEFKKWFNTVTFTIYIVKTKHAFKVNTNMFTNENICSSFLPHPTPLIVFRRKQTVCISNDDDTLVPMITSSVKLRWTSWNIMC